MTQRFLTSSEQLSVVDVTTENCLFLLVHQLHQNVFLHRKNYCSPVCVSVFCSAVFDRMQSDSRCWDVGQGPLTIHLLIFLFLWRIVPLFFSFTGASSHPPAVSGFPLSPLCNNRVQTGHRHLSRLKHTLPAIFSYVNMQADWCWVKCAGMKGTGSIYTWSFSLSCKRQKHLVT